MSATFPEYIQKQLNELPPTNPGRHDALKDLSLQMVGEHIPDDEIFSTLREWCPDRDKTDKEVWDLIKGAHAKNPQPASRYSREQLPSIKVKKFKPTGERKPLPSNLADYTPIDYLRATFGPDELVCITWTNRYGKPTEDDIRTVDEWETVYKGDASFFSHKDGVYYMVNPAKSKQGGHEKENLADFRNCLVELEVSKKDRPKLDEKARKAKGEEFYAAALASGLPIRAISTSGGPSIHITVAIDAADEAEYKERVKHVYDYCASMPGFDKTNKNSSRLSRLPGAERDGRKQALLCIATAAASYDEWLESVEEWPLLGDDTSEITEDKMPPEPPVLVENFLHSAPEVVSITGAMKTNKSWTLLDLAIAVAEEGKWLDKQCAKGRVLYLDAELNRPFWYLRVKLICEAIGINFNDLMQSRAITPVFLQSNKMEVAEVKCELERMIASKKLGKYDVIIFDPIYQFLASDWEENSNDDIRKCGQCLQEIACLTGCPVVFAHHDSKGNKEGVRGIERSSGGGAFGRVVAANLSIGYKGTGDGGEEQEYELCWKTTNFRNQEKQIARRRNFVWEIIDKAVEKEDALERLIRETIAVFPQDEDYVRGAVWWQSIESAGIDVSKDRFEKVIRNTAMHRGLIGRRGDGKKVEWVLTPSGLELKNRERDLVSSSL